MKIEWKAHISYNEKEEESRGVSHVNDQKAKKKRYISLRAEKSARKTPVWKMTPGMEIEWGIKREMKTVHAQVGFPHFFFPQPKLKHSQTREAFLFLISLSIPILLRPFCLFGGFTFLSLFFPLGPSLPRRLERKSSVLSSHL